eukprot:gene24142-30454_t
MDSAVTVGANIALDKESEKESVFEMKPQESVENDAVTAPISLGEVVSTEVSDEVAESAVEDNNIAVTSSDKVVVEEPLVVAASSSPLGSTTAEVPGASPVKTTVICNQYWPSTVTHLPRPLSNKEIQSTVGGLKLSSELTCIGMVPFEWASDRKLVTTGTADDRQQFLRNSDNFCLIEAHRFVETMSPEMYFEEKKICIDPSSTIDEDVKKTKKVAAAEGPSSTAKALKTLESKFTSDILSLTHIKRVSIIPDRLTLTAPPEVASVVTPAKSRSGGRSAPKAAEPPVVVKKEKRAAVADGDDDVVANKKTTRSYTPRGSLGIVKTEVLPPKDATSVNESHTSSAPLQLAQLQSSNAALEFQLLMAREAQKTAHLELQTAQQQQQLQAAQHQVQLMQQAQRLANESAPVQHPAQHQQYPVGSHQSHQPAGFGPQPQPSFVHHNTMPHEHQQIQLPPSQQQHQHQPANYQYSHSLGAAPPLYAQQSFLSPGLTQYAPQQAFAPHQHPQIASTAMYPPPQQHQFYPPPLNYGGYLQHQVYGNPLPPQPMHYGMYGGFAPPPPNTSAVDKHRTTRRILDICDQLAEDLGR